MRDNINEIQKTILKTIINGDIDVRELSFLDFNIFWRYKNIFNTILKIDKDQLKKEWLLHSEFAKIDENNNIIDIISCDYYSANPYRDIEYLCKTTLIQNNLPVDEAIQQYKKLESIRLELFKKMSGWESKNYCIDTVLDSSYLLSKKAKEKVWILGYSTGLPSLDKYTDWLQKGTVMRVTAYSNIGKSKLSYHVCNSVLDQKAKVLYFSLEVKKEFVFYNLLCNRYWIEFWDVARWCWHDMDITAMQNADIEIIDDKYSLTDILLYAESRKPDVVFIDFVQNIRTDNKDEYSAMTEVAIKIQQLAIKNNIAVFDLSQISNDWAWYELGWVIKSKWSGALVASADIWLVMQREKDTNHNLLFVAKNKFGINTKCIDLQFNFPNGQIRDLGDHLTKSLTI